MPDSSNTLHLPLLIARALVVFPGISEEIEAGRAFSLAAVDAARTTSNNILFLVSQKNGDSDEIEGNLYAYGSLVRIVNCTNVGGGYRIRVVGSKRVALSNIQMENGSYYADGMVLVSENGDPDQERALVAQLVEAVSQSRALGARLSRGALNQIAKAAEGSDELPDTIAAYLPIALEQKEAVLEEINIPKRLLLLLSYVNEAKQAAEIDAKIEDKVRESADKAQKDYILRERMKAIKQELGEDPNDEHSEDAIREKLKKNPYPENVKAVILVESSSTIDVSKTDVSAFKNIPFLFVWGDFLGGEYVNERFKWIGDFAYSGTMRKLHEKIVELGGDSTWWHLPEMGIKGNTHAMMKEDNSRQIADMIGDWIKQHVK